MDLYFNGLKVGQIPIVAATTVGELRQTLSNWLVPQGITAYTVRINLNNGTVITDTVFQTNMYDEVNFQAQEALLNGGSVQVNETNVPIPVTTQPQPVINSQEFEVMFDFIRFYGNLRDPAILQQWIDRPENEYLRRYHTASSAKGWYVNDIPAIVQLLTNRGFRNRGAPIPVAVAAPAPILGANLYTEAELKQFKVTQLKDILRAKRLKVSGNKAELITRIMTSPDRVDVVNPPAPAPAPGPLEQMFEALIGLIPNAYTVIVKLQKVGDNIIFSVGRVTPAGSFKPYYADNVNANTYVRQNLLPHLRPLMDRYNRMIPNKRTLFFRYSNKRKMLEIFTTSGMNLRTRVNL